ncbi:MAG TPA: hypothetical protein VF153_03360 [Candidatus Limnocylindria bacterium]
MLDSGMNMRRFLPPATLVMLVLAACSNATPSGTSSATSSAPTPPASASASASASATPFPAAYEKGAAYAPTIDPANFVEAVDNPYFPLVPGTRWVMQAHGGSAGEMTITLVTHQTKTIMGIKCTVVRDEVDLNGELKELTHDWYAQDSEGNVWYMGEETAEYRNGHVSTREGSWEAGVGGAVPGIIMPGSPIVDLTYRQEFLKGSAEDLAKVVDLSAKADTPFDTFTDVRVTEDWTPLEPNIVERKYYARGVGLVMEQLVQGGNGTNKLTEYRSAS